MFTLNLPPIFKARGIEKPYSFLVKSGFTSFTAHKLIRGQADYLHFRHIEKLCLLLNCTPNDLLNWKADPNDNIPENHELRKMKTLHIDIDLNKTLRSLPIEQIQELIKTAKDLNSDKKE